jgi:FKBP-type peptidyl-prolyl cis-trans isomerase 2
LRGIDEFLVGKEPGKYSVKLSPASAFGLKDPKLIQLVPASKFKKEGLDPFPGMQVMVDEQMAVVRRVSGGRILVDFNHPLSGLEVIYDLEIIKEVTDTKVKFETYVAYAFGPIKTEFAEGVGTMYVKKEVPAEVTTILKDQCKKIIPEIKDILFKVEEKKAEEAKS